MNHTSDWIEKARRQIIPRIGIVTQLIEDVTGANLYVEGETGDDQFVGCVPLSEEEFEKELDEMGFSRNPLASWKSLGSPSGETEEGSWRMTDFPDNQEYQLHVLLYDGSHINNADTGETYIYAHWELAWDARPIDHYRGKNISTEEGVRRMRNLLTEQGINYDKEKRP